MTEAISKRTRDTSQTIQERIAATHVIELGVDLDAMPVISNIFRVSVLFHNLADQVAKYLLIPLTILFNLIFALSENLVHNGFNFTAI